MKVKLARAEEKVTIGEGDDAFDYYYRPLTVEEKSVVTSHIVYTVGKRASVDFAKTDLLELVKMSVTKIDRLYDSTDQKIDTIDKLCDLQAEPGFIDNVILLMWVEIWKNMVIPEELKKKL